ncbi:MAG: bifunctional adenosylcobinamide kinase/adenosylcobinamide-phosphate guanylyltransferase [Cyanobacteria bacterium SID2]|nr:bifunctional adenosylcobinamide kinase/adenosylcobinamide-phosphate guanylyltransferase [Cyanobacteria bacterium SID2]MBP0005798.1 bifunctional adenosylcobinamide kinase/adenosylcobinamide-phosphate guanylyltransferase [Cyanobacteria bacterium SBC]
MLAICSRRSSASSRWAWLSSRCNCSAVGSRFSTIDKIRNKKDRHSDRLFPLYCHGAGESAVKSSQFTKARGRMGQLILVTGPARSGKSELAEQLAPI